LKKAGSTFCAFLQKEIGQFGGKRKREQEKGRNLVMQCDVSAGGFPRSVFAPLHGMRDCSVRDAIRLDGAIQKQLGVCLVCW
jgi:hypothetical protein